MIIMKEVSVRWEEKEVGVREGSERKRGMNMKTIIRVRDKGEKRRIEEKKKQKKGKKRISRWRRPGNPTLLILTNLCNSYAFPQRGVKALAVSPPSSAFIPLSYCIVLCVCAWRPHIVALCIHSTVQATKCCTKRIRNWPAAENSANIQQRSFLPTSIYHHHPFDVFISLSD